MLFVMETPAHEFAPAALYEQESAAYYRRWKLAVAVSRGLSVAFAHAERPQFRPGRAEHEAHQADVHTMTDLARRAGRDAGWVPCGLYASWLKSRCVSWAEVCEQLRSERQVA
jgi:hypothetical protein